MAVSRHDATPLTSEELVHHLQGRGRATSVGTGALSLATLHFWL